MHIIGTIGKKTLKFVETNNNVGEYKTIDMVGVNPKKNQPAFFLRNARERSYCKLAPCMQFLWLPQCVHRLCSRFQVCNLNKKYQF